MCSWGTPSMPSPNHTAVPQLRSSRSRLDRPYSCAIISFDIDLLAPEGAHAKKGVDSMLTHSFRRFCADSDRSPRRSYSLVPALTRAVIPASIALIAIAALNCLSAGDGQQPSGPVAGSPCSGETPAGVAMCGPGQSCYATSWSPPTYACSPAGSRLEVELCSLDNDCGVGMTCIFYEASFGSCRYVCAADADCPSNYQCGGSFYGNATDTAPARKYCQKRCFGITFDDSQRCGYGFKCGFDCTAQDPTWATCDVHSGPNISGPCTNENECAGGYVCLNGVCTETCDVNADCFYPERCSGQLSCGSTLVGFQYCR